jgi:hypothetical protein
VGKIKKKKCAPLVIPIDARSFNYVARDGVVVKALRYKPAGRVFDSRFCH